MTALIVMRTQPITNGHKAVIDDLLTKHQVIIGIGSSNVVNVRNPLTANQRRILWNVLYSDEIQTGKLFLVNIPDIGAPNKHVWSEHLRSCLKEANLPNPTHYYGGEENISFISGFHHICPLPRLEQNSVPVSGTLVRELINSDGDWKQYVPAKIHDLVERYMGRR